MASHLTLRTRQGRHDLLALGARFPVSLCPLCGSRAEVFINGEELRLLVGWKSGLRWQREGGFDIDRGMVISAWLGVCKFPS